MALAEIERFDADLGGTEIYEPLEYALEKIEPIIE